MLEKINILHQQLRKAKYFYYECEDINKMSIMTDYEFDILEKEYDKLCEDFKVPEKYRLSSYVGFDIAMPMSLYNFYKNRQWV